MGRRWMSPAASMEVAKGSAKTGVKDEPHMPDELEPLLINAKGFAKLLGVTPARIWTMDGSGKVPMPLYLGRSRRWRPAEIREWMRLGQPRRQEWETTKWDLGFEGPLRRMDW